MAYSSTNPVQLWGDGLGPLAQRTFIYASTHNSTDILATGFFTAVGDGSRGLNTLGMRVGDLLINRASTSASNPGRVTMHSVINSTANFSSTTLSSGYSAAYDCTVASAT